MYQSGDEVKMTVNNIVPYGVFGTTEEGDICFIYIAHVRDAYIKDLNKYFRIGDTVKGIVIGRQEDGKLSVSVEEYPLPEYETEERKVILEELNHENEINHIYDYMEKLVGQLSNEAKTKVNELIKEYGMVKVSLELGKKTNFKEDPGLMLAENVEKNLRGYL